jgi:hypothetical protein
VTYTGRGGRGDGLAIGTGAAGGTATTHSNTVVSVSNAAVSNTAVPGTAIAGPPGADRGRGSSPSRLWAALAGAVLALTGLGVTAAVTTAARESTETRAVNSAEHLVVDVDELYQSLADADATAATALLSGQVAPARLTDQYASDVQQAESALAEASRDLAGDETASTLLGQVPGQLATYTGLVATAQANNRLGYPVAAAYLREASGYLRGTVLPEVQAVADRAAPPPHAAQGAVEQFPYWLYIVAVAAAVLLVRAHRTLGRITRRRINPGLALGALLGAALLVWSAYSTAHARTLAAHAESKFAQVGTTLDARAQVALAQSFQSLSLIDRGEDGGTDQAGQDKAVKQLTADAAGLPGTAAPLKAVTDQMARLTTDVVNGQYTDAVTLAVGQGDKAAQDTVIARAAALDQVLKDDFQTYQNAYGQDGGQAASLLDGGLWIGLIGGVLAAAAAAYGVNRRLAEYR